MLEVGRMVWSWCEQHDTRLVAMVWRQAAQGLAPGIKKRCQALHLGLVKHVGQGPRHDETIFQSISGSGRALGAVSEHPPLAIGGPGQVGSVEVEIVLLRYRYVVTGAEETGVSENQFGR